MRVTVKHLEGKVDTVNRLLGFDPDTLAYNTVGSVQLYQAYGGYDVHRVVNESHGVSSLTGGCDTARRAADFLSGMISALYIVKEQK